MTIIYCAKPGCQNERLADQPYCHEHRQAVGRPAGRPYSDNPRNIRVRVQFSADEVDRLTKAAEKEGVGVPELVRSALARIIRPETACPQSEDSMPVVGNRAPDGAEETFLRGKIVRTLRVAKGLRQEDLAEVAGVSRATIVRIEADDEEWEPSVTTLGKIAVALEVDIRDLVEVKVVTSDVAAALEVLKTDGQVTPEEIEWVRALPPTFWRGWGATPPALAALLEARKRVTR